MKHWKVITAGVLGLLLSPLLAWATQITIPSAPGSGYFWVSTSTGAAIYTPFSTTSASCSGNTSCSSFTVFGSSPITISSSGGSGGSGNVSTSTHETAGGIAYWTSNSATPALLGEVATSTLTPSSPPHWLFCASRFFRLTWLPNRIRLAGRLSLFNRLDDI